MATTSTAPLISSDSQSAEVATTGAPSPRSLLYVKSSSQYRRSSSRRLLRRMDKEHSQRSLRHAVNTRSNSRDEDEITTKEEQEEDSSVVTATTKNRRFSLSARVSLSNLYDVDNEEDDDDDESDKEQEHPQPMTPKQQQPSKPIRQLRSRPKLQKHHSNDSSSPPPSKASPHVQALQQTYQKQLRDSQETLQFHWERAQARLARHNPTGAHAALKHVAAQRQRQNGLVAVLQFLLTYSDQHQNHDEDTNTSASLHHDDRIMHLQHKADQIMASSSSSNKSTTPEEQEALDAQLMQELKDSLQQQDDEDVSK